MPPRIDGITLRNLREQLGRSYVDDEPLRDFQGIWAMPEVPAPHTLHDIEIQPLNGDINFPDIQQWIEESPQTFGVDYGTGGHSTISFVSTFNETLRKMRKDEEEYKQALDKQWNELMFGQA